MVVTTQSTTNRSRLAKLSRDDWFRVKYSCSVKPSKAAAAVDGLAFEVRADLGHLVDEVGVM